MWIYVKMGDEIKQAIIKKTQDTLGKFIKRPPLTEKLLRKPPFRFLHDVITTVVRETKFFDGLFTDDEMNSETVNNKESKMAFLQKVIDVVNISCGVSLAVRPAKIVAGYEPEKTNELLQIIGRAIEKKVDSSVAVQRVLSKTRVSIETEQPNAKKAHPKKEEQGKSKKAVQPAVEKKLPKEKTGSDALKQKVSKSIAVKGEDKERKEPLTTGRDESKRLHITKEKKPKKSEEITVALSRDARIESKAKAAAVAKEREKKPIERAAAGSGRRVVGSGRRGSLAIMSNEPIKEAIGGGEMVGEGSEVVVVEEEGGEVRLPTKNASLDRTDVPEVEDTFASLEPPVSEQENAQANVQEPIRGHEVQENSSAKAEGNTSRAGSHKKRILMSVMPNEELRSTASSGQRMAISTPVVRPLSAMSTAPSRPRSSRPHAPRLRSALGGLIPADEVMKGGRAKGGEKRVAESTAVGPMGDATVDDAEAIEFLVEEARPPSSSAIRQVNLEVGGEELGGAGVEDNEGKPHGLLVAKILETKKELELGVEEGGGSEGVSQAKRIEIEYSEEEARERRRRGVGQVEDMQSMVQAVARAAHPLGSLVAVLQENVDSMRMEMGKWRAKSEKLLWLLREEEKQMDLELEPLHSVLFEVEQRAVEEREAVSAAKVRFLKAEERIHVMLDPKRGAHIQTTLLS